MKKFYAALYFISIWLLLGHFSPAYAEMVYCVQIATFSDANNARGVFQKIDKAFSPEQAPSLRIESSNGFYNVLVGMYPEKQPAQQLLAKLIGMFPEAYVRTSFFDNDRIVRFRENKTGQNAQTATTVTTAEQKEVSPQKQDSDAHLQSVGTTVASLVKNTAPQQTPDKSAATAPAAAVSAKKAPKPVAAAPVKKASKPAAVAPSKKVSKPAAAVAKPSPEASQPAKISPADSAKAAAPERKNTGGGNPAAARSKDDQPKAYPAEWSTLDQKRALQRNFALGIAVIAAMLPTLFLWSRKKKIVSASHDGKPKVLEAREPPSLSENDETILFRNIGQLRDIEGVLLSTAPNARTLYVMSSFPGEARTMTALQLAYALSMNKTARVLLVDGNPTKKPLTGLFGISSMRGFSDFMHAESTLEECVHATSYADLFVMPFGTRTEDFFAYIRKETFPEALKKLQGEFDYVIMVGSAGMRTYEAPFIGSQFDGVILAIECEKTKWEVVQVVLEKLHALNANIIGAVITYRQFYIPRFLYGKL